MSGGKFGNSKFEDEEALERWKAPGLKSCPFCGSENISSEEVMGKHVDETFFKQTACLDCGACGPEDNKTPNLSADEGWNMRAIETGEPALSTGQSGE